MTPEEMLLKAEDVLLDMMWQYLHGTFDGELTHDFMSAGEHAIEYMKLRDYMEYTPVGGKLTEKGWQLLRGEL